MAMTQAQIIKYVRNRTTDNLRLLPDDKIEDFTSSTDEGGNLYTDGLDLNGVLADSWEYISRGDLYGTQQAGAVLISQPVAERKAARYLSLSRKGGGGVSVTVGIVTRTDITQPVSTVSGEFSL